MKLLVSDYDGTFNFLYQNRIIKKNIDAINSFRKRGNIFAISTARSYSSIFRETERFNIPYDYLICKNGRDIVDSNGEIIYSRTINDEDLSRVLEMIDYLYGISSEVFFNAKGEEVFYNSVAAKITTEKLFFPSRVKSICNYDMYSVKVKAFLNRIDISTFSNKSDAILELLKYLKNEILLGNIYTIGNASNDYDMLQNYQGYKMYLSSLSLLLSSVPFSEGVYSLVKKIR